MTQRPQKTDQVIERLVELREQQRRLNEEIGSVLQEFVRRTSVIRQTQERVRRDR